MSEKNYLNRCNLYLSYIMNEVALSAGASRQHNQQEGGEGEKSEAGEADKKGAGEEESRERQEEREGICLLYTSPSPRDS